MNLPGFAAEASLYGSNNRYLRVTHQLIEGNVYPANYVDQNCLRDCKKDCGSVCAGTAGSAKSACIHECALDNAQCNSACLRPGNPPGSGNPPAGSSPVCTVQDNRRCFLFGISFLPVPPGTFGAVCSGGCTQTCCHTSGDQRLCGISSVPCT
jgi:hypothetical protein